MRIPFDPRFVFSSLMSVAILGGCQRNVATGADAPATPVTAARAGANGGSAPLPVSPPGLTNPSTAAQGNDLTNSTAATGHSNSYQPPSTDNPASGAANASAPAASQSVSSRTLGTSPMPNDGTVPSGVDSGAKR